MKSTRKMEFIASVFFLLTSLMGCQKDLPLTPKLTLQSADSLVSKRSDTLTVKNPVPPTIPVPVPVPVPGAGAPYIVAPTGDDSNPGSLAKPFKTLAKAYSIAKAGDTIYFRTGKYAVTNTNASVGISLNRNINGSEGKMILFWAFPGEKPVIDLSAITYTGGTIWGILVTGNYLHWKGFEVTGLPLIQAQYTHSAFMAKDCNHCIFENMIVHDNDGMGLVLAGNSDKNLIVNCDAYNNQDALTISDPYGNADGFHIGVISNTAVENTLRGCRSWYNSDDGYDCYNNEGSVIFENCWALWNGYKVNSTEAAGDGDGFKLGNSQGTYTTVKRTLTGCIAANNHLTGIDLNDGKFAVNLSRCISYNNANHGIYLNKFNMTNNISNCIATANKSGYNALITAQSTVTNCSWKGFDVSASNFKSVDVKQLLTNRTVDFNLPSTTCLQLSAASTFQFK